VSVINLKTREHLRMLRTFGIFPFGCPCYCTLCISDLRNFSSVLEGCAWQNVFLSNGVLVVVLISYRECTGCCTWYSFIKLQVIPSLKSRYDFFSLDSRLSRTPYLPLYKPHCIDKNLPSKIGVRLMHGILYPFDDWARDTCIVCCETPSRDC
jgi:hypothetical protein